MAAKSIKLLYQNVRGLRTKTNLIYNKLLLLDYDIVLLTETWLYDGIFDSEIAPDRFNVFRRDRGSLGGGVMALCDNKLQVLMRNDLMSPNVECLWIIDYLHLMYAH